MLHQQLSAAHGGSRPSVVSNMIALAKQLHPLLEWVRYPVVGEHRVVRLPTRGPSHAVGAPSSPWVSKVAGALYQWPEACLAHGRPSPTHRTMTTHPSSTTHSQVSEEELKGSLKPEPIRMLVGIEEMCDRISPTVIHRWSHCR